MFEKVFPSEEPDRCEEGDDANSYAIIASVSVIVEEAGFPPFALVVAPALGGYAAKDDYRKEL